jgi:hypothetical protein
MTPAALQGIAFGGQNVEAFLKLGSGFVLTASDMTGTFRRMRRKPKQTITTHKSTKRTADDRGNNGPKQDPKQGRRLQNEQAIFVERGLDLATQAHEFARTVSNALRSADGSA